MPARPDVNRIVEFEALRGLLALWVVVGHAIKHAGYSKVDLGALKFVAEPGLAVDVFIVLSGFVIFNLLDQQRQSYWTFIVQRFFRLYPLYLAVLLCSAAVAYRYEAWLALFPWQNDAVVSALKIAHATSQNLMAQLIVHLTMLQGIVPDFVLPKSEYAIVGQAWSISVEWQFYLVAPLLFWLVRRSPVALAGVVLALVAAHSQYWLGEGFALNQAGYFLIGILSYFAFKAISSQSVNFEHVALGVVSAIALAAFFSDRSLSLALWFLFLGASTMAKLGVGNPISMLCNLGPVRWLGKVSYSIYLTHMLVLFGVSNAVLTQWPYITKVEHAMLTLPTTVLATVAFSGLCFRLIEQPGMKFGKHVLSGRSVDRWRGFASRVGD